MIQPVNLRFRFAYYPTPFLDLVFYHELLIYLKEGIFLFFLLFFVQGLGRYFYPLLKNFPFFFSFYNKFDQM